MTSADLPALDTAAARPALGLPRLPWGLIAAWIVALLFATPVLYALFVSLMPRAALVARDFSPSVLTLDNYVRVWTEHPFPRYFANSLIVAGAITAGAMITSIMAAYVLARTQITGRAVLFVAIVATLMIPGHVTLIPNYLTLAGAGLRNSYAGLVLPFLASGFATFFLRQHFLTVPQEVIDAARIDGAGHWRILWGIVVPMTAPAVAAIAVFLFLAEWNSYLWPMVMTDRAEMRTIEIGIARLFQDEGTSGQDWPLIVAAALSVMVPPALVFVAAERHLVGGVAVGGVK